MLSKQEFLILTSLLKQPESTQREIAEAVGVSLGTVNAAVKTLRESGCLDNYNVTEAGLKALEPYRVENAIIMAAGMSSRFAPISYERPKGVLTVRGEVLIERQIRQLKEAGINDITVVVGYCKEQFFYLEDEFGVTIRVNEQYATRNNNSTLMLVKEKLGNTYVCSSDDYFTENVFEPYVYEAYYAAEFFKGETNEYCITTGAHDVITKVEVGGCDSYAMLGHVYFDRAFSKKFTSILVDEYDLPSTAGKLWEDIYIAHIDELRMVMRPYPKGVLNEFDSLEELNGFDPSFLDNVDSSILDNICRIMECKRIDITGIKPIKRGLTNLSFHFVVRGEEYVYRHPGAGTEEIINRESEAYSQDVARDLGLDDTFVYEDGHEGWKISRYVTDCELLDYHNEVQVAAAMRMARTLHSCGKVSKWTFNVHENTRALIEKLDASHRSSFRDFKTLFELIDGLNAAVKADDVKPCLCHNDFYSPNILFADGRGYLIDWEYSGMSDYASDLGTFICCSDYTYDEAVHVLHEYFQREPTKDELFHCVAYIAICSYYWFIWALCKDACGAPVGEWLYLWYKNAKAFGKKANELKSA